MFIDEVVMMGVVILWLCMGLVLLQWVIRTREGEDGDRGVN
jgi:hypothetical protein